MKSSIGIALLPSLDTCTTPALEYEGSAKKPNKMNGAKVSTPAPTATHL